MSYRPPTRGSAPPGGPSGYTVTGIRLRRKKAVVPWYAGCGLLFVGFLLGVAGLFLAALLYFGSPVSNQAFARPEYSGTPDLSATLSEIYLNTTVTRYLKANPLTISNIVGVKDIVLQVRPKEQIGVQLKLGNNLVDFDIGVTEAVSVKKGKLVLTPVGQPTVGKGNLPISTDVVISLVNSALIEPEINRSLAEVAINNRPFNLVDVTTATGAITIKFNAP